MNNLNCWRRVGIRHIPTGLISDLWPQTTNAQRTPVRSLNAAS
jgi:hypothetical protein